MTFHLCGHVTSADLQLEGAATQRASQGFVPSLCCTWLACWRACFLCVYFVYLERKENPIHAKDRNPGLKMGSFTVVLVCLFFLGCEGRPDGAPRSACQTLTPQHSGIQPQQSSPPYSVSVTKVGDKLRVKVFSSIGEELEGFILQARYARDRTRMVDGHFTTRDGVSRTIDCFNGKQNTLTQFNPTPKREIVTEWTPTTALDEDVVFRATVAKTFAIFWTKVDSSPIRIKSDAASPSNGARSDRKEAGGSSVYQNCFVSKGCFGIPSGCINRQDCQVLLSYMKAIDGISFRMVGYLEDNSYMAMGLSNDPLMGDDFVTECVLKDSSIVLRHSWNEGKTNGRTREIPSDLYQSMLNDGISGCAFTLPFTSQYNGREYNLANNTYYTLLAKGPMRNERLSYHQLRSATQQSVNFSAFEAIESEGITDSVKIHGVTEENSQTIILENNSSPVEDTVTVTPSFKNSDSEFDHNSGALLSLNILLVLVVVVKQIFLQAVSH